MEIRKVRPNEYRQWLDLRELLWPNTSLEELAREQEEILADLETNCVLVASHFGNELVGFVEIAIRDWAEGCASRPVGYLEAWYVKPEHRRSKVGRRLLDAVEAWVLSRGCAEMGSDAELQNDLSHQAHRAAGYDEVVRVVLFSKKLNK